MQVQDLVTQPKEDSKDSSTENESRKQKAEEISAIYTHIIRHCLSRFCKANATALALIFKALMRGEMVYSKVQFLQDLDTNHLLCQKTEEINTANTQNDSLPQELKSSPMYHKRESKNNKSVNKDIQISKQSKNQQKNNQINLQQDAKNPAQSTESKPSDNSSTLFPLNIEG